MSTRDAAEKSTLENALRKADELLVTSLKGEEHQRRDRRRRAALLGLLALVCVAGTVLVVQRWSRWFPARATAPQVSAAEWSKRLTTTRPSGDGSDWRAAFATASDLAELPPEQSWAILRDNWARVPAVSNRQQYLKAFAFARNNPRMLDVLDLGMNDPAPEVRSWAAGYLNEYAFRDFSGDSSAYLAWRKQTAGRDVEQVRAESAAAWAQRIAAANGADLAREARLANGAARGLVAHPAARDAAVRTGVVDVALRWLREHDDNQDIARGAGEILAAIQPDEAFLRANILPLASGEHSLDVRYEAIRALGAKGNDWAVEPLLELLKKSLGDPQDKQLLATCIAQSLAEIGDVRAVPTMIGVIAADDTSDTIYGVGYFGLQKLTGVGYDETHTGAWWRQWWQRERDKLPDAVRAQEIPAIGEPSTTPSGGGVGNAMQSLASTLVSGLLLANDDEPEPPVQDLRAGGEEMMRYFLIGPRARAKEPPAGYRLMLVLPGGDGSADFKPFVTNIAQQALPDGYLVAQLVAPKWRDDENRIVWPTTKTRDAKMKFPTEAFIDSVARDVAAKFKIDSQHVYALGWSSGGPPVYAASMRDKTPLTGAFVAMSVFKPDELPPAKNAKGCAFYILHSPQDFIPMRFPQSAQTTLKAAGAKVQLTTYQGGHGWHGDIFGQIRAGVKWLHQQSPRSPTSKATSTSAPAK